MNDADISLINSEGQCASLVAKTAEIKNMIKGKYVCWIAIAWQQRNLVLNK